MSFANMSLKENNSDIIDESLYKTILEKIDKSLIELEFELDEIDYYASDEEIELLKKRIEERKQAIQKNKEQIYELFKKKNI
jgi:cob(I)alamin adenosyltransferase